VTTHNVTLSQLIPFANYEVSVKFIPLIEDYEINNLTPRGYWSSAVYDTFTTLPDGRFNVRDILQLEVDHSIECYA